MMTLGPTGAGSPPAVIVAAGLAARQGATGPSGAVVRVTCPASFCPDT